MTITKSGELASFYTVNKAPIKHLRVYFSPKQSGSGDPSPENVREISGWNNITYHKCKHIRKIIPVNFTTIVNNGVSLEYLGEGVFSLHGEYTNDIAVFDLDIEPFNLTIQDQYFSFFSNYHNSVSQYDMVFSIKDIDKKTILNVWPMSGRYNTIFSYLNLGDEQIEYISDNTCQKIRMVFIKGITDITFSLIFSDNLNTGKIDFGEDIGEIYGGYVDLITGELVKTWECETDNNKTWTVTSDGNAYQWYHTPGNANGTPNWYHDSICTHLKNISYVYVDNNSSVGVNNAGALYFGKRFWQAMGYEENVTQQQVIDFFENQRLAGTPVYVSYPLATPITYQLTPQQLETLLGRNNIWSNADRVEIEYDLAESNDILYRRRNVLEKQYPHIITPAANGLINFNTDIKAPLKQCKVYFNPIQEGSGDPSPDNVRPITGWTGLSLYHSEGNLYTPNPNNKGYISSSGVINVDTTSTYTDLIPVIVGNTYTFRYTTASVNGNTNRRIHGYDSSGNWVKQLAVGTTAANIVEERKILATIPSGISYIRVSFRNQDTNVRVAREDVYDISWENEAGTVYGGYLDLIKGEIVITYAQYTFTGNELWQKGSVDHRFFVYCHNIIPLLMKPQQMVQNALQNVYTNIFGQCIYTNKDGVAYIVFESNNTICYLVINENSIETIDDIKNITNEMQFVYELKTPIAYQIDPVTLKTLRGTNNIWSNSNGNIELSYWTH